MIKKKLSCSHVFFLFSENSGNTEEWLFSVTVKKNKSEFKLWKFVFPSYCNFRLADGLTHDYM